MILKKPKEFSEFELELFEDLNSHSNDADFSELLFRLFRSWPPEISRALLDQKQEGLALDQKVKEKVLRQLEHEDPVNYSKIIHAKAFPALFAEGISDSSAIASDIKALDKIKVTLTLDEYEAGLRKIERKIQAQEEAQEKYQQAEQEYEKANELLAANVELLALQKQADIITGQVDVQYARLIMSCEALGINKNDSLLTKAWNEYVYFIRVKNESLASIYFSNEYLLANLTPPSVKLDEAKRTP